MMKKTQNKVKPVVIVVGGVATVALLYFLYRFLTKEESGMVGEDPKKNNNSFCKHKGFPLRYGSCGDEVKDLQRLLNRIIRPPLTLLKVDGKFGKKTEVASKKELGSKSVSTALFYQTRLAKAPDLSFISKT